MSAGVKELVTRVERYLPEEKVALVRSSYRFAAECHNGQTRVSGGPYIEHPLQTALFLADLRLDVTTLVAALLHDVIEDCGVTYDQLEERFGEDVARLVDGVTKLTRLDARMAIDGDSPQAIGAQDDRLQAESLRKMLVAMAEDVRVVLIKLADRLHNMRTLGVLPAQRRRAIAQETLDIYTPLAHRLGIWDIKWRLEDMAFRHLDPVKYREISRMLAAKTRRAGGLRSQSLRKPEARARHGRSGCRNRWQAQAHLQHLPQDGEVHHPGQEA